MKSAALILLTTGIVLGASMVQTDWSGGPSGEVTTTDWGSGFGSSEHVNRNETFSRNT